MKKIQWRKRMEMTGNSNLEIEEETVRDILEDDELENILWDMFVEHIKNKKKGQSNNWII